MQEFFNMGGYASFIWPSYLVTAVVMVGLLVVSIRKRKSVEAALAALQQTQKDEPK
ncbi:MAG: heme exporter protein CcmD [Alphaproteobacteria bacterium]